MNRGKPFGMGNHTRRNILPQQQNTKKSEERTFESKIDIIPIQHRTDERIPGDRQWRERKYNIISLNTLSLPSSKQHSTIFHTLHKYLPVIVKHNGIPLQKPSIQFSSVLQRNNFFPRDKPKDRIFKGWEASFHEFPWMVKVKV